MHVMHTLTYLCAPALIVFLPKPVRSGDDTGDDKTSEYHLEVVASAPTDSSATGASGATTSPLLRSASEQGWPKREVIPHGK